MLSIAVLALGPRLLAAATLDAATPAEAAQAIVKARAGDTVRLAPGNYGKLMINITKQNQVSVGKAVIRGRAVPLRGPATITSADPNRQAVLNGIENRGAPFWHFSALRVVPTGNTKSIAIRLQAPDNALVGNHFGHTGYEDWTIDEWKRRAARMVYSNGARTTVSDNRFDGMFHGIIFAYGADGSRAENNVMRGIGGDGFNVPANHVSIIHVSIIGNNMANFFQINGNHDDCL